MPNLLRCDCGNMRRPGRQTCYECRRKAADKARYRAEKALRRVQTGPVEVSPGCWSVRCTVCLRPLMLDFKPTTSKVCDDCFAPRPASERGRMVARGEVQAHGKNLEG